MISNKFSEIWIIDFEFFQPAGEQPEVLCLAAQEYYSGRQEKIWLKESKDVACPIPSGPDVLVVSYYGVAEFTCFLVLGWEMPLYTIDLFVEAKNLLNGQEDTKKLSLARAMKIFGISFDFSTKLEMRELAMRGGAYSEEEQKDLLKYCESDVEAETLLLRKLFSSIVKREALLRGRYVQVAAHVEFTGVPFDVTTWQALKANLKPVQDKIISFMSEQYDVFARGTWKHGKFEALINRMKIQDWPVTKTGKLKTDKETLKEMAELHPSLNNLKDFKLLLEQLRPAMFGVGKDGRHRYMQSLFSSKTGRAQPSTTKCIWAAFGCFKGLIKPFEGTAVASVDWCQQELGIAAALSGDENMKESYLSGDPYLNAAIKAGAVPESATKETHPTERGLFKQTSLGVLFGMTKKGLAKKAKVSEAKAEELINQHKSTYRKFWKWNEKNVDAAFLHKNISSVFGWNMYVSQETKENTLMNFPMQANGAEMLRLAMILTHEQGVRIIASVHDSIVIEAPVNLLDEHIRITQEAMCQASEIVLDGFKLRTDVDTCYFPNRFISEKHLAVWEFVCAEMGKISRRETGEVLI